MSTSCTSAGSFTGSVWSRSVCSFFDSPVLIRKNPAYPAEQKTSSFDWPHGTQLGQMFFFQFLAKFLAPVHPTRHKPYRESNPKPDLFVRSKNINLTALASFSSPDKMGSQRRFVGSYVVLCFQKI